LKRRIARILLSQGRIEESAAKAEEAFNETAKDDWATVASTNTMLGEVRAAQGRHAEAEELLRKGADVISTTDFPQFDMYRALAAFLVGKGEVEEGLEWLRKARASIREFPPGSPMRDFLDKRADQVEATARAAARK
jgi:ATP/maltotriose-dependent transcriptional regulator MalT